MESNICNIITFTIEISPSSETFAQPEIIWDNFLTSPNDSLMIKNKSMLQYSNGILTTSYYLQGNLQNETIIFNANFPSLKPNSINFANTVSDPLSFVVNTSPEALLTCC